MLNYLAVHDFVWINATVLGKTVSFDFEKLEAAMAAQYNYGESNDAAGQAANLLETMLTKRPFESGSIRTAFIAVVSFLSANKYSLQVDDKAAASIFEHVAAGELSAAEAIGEMFKLSDLALRSSTAIRALVAYICNEHAEALKLLAEGD